MHQANKPDVIRRTVVMLSTIVVLIGAWSFIFTDFVLGYDPNPHDNHTNTTDHCAACHGGHAAPSAGLIASTEQADAFCNSCHNGLNASAVSSHTNQGGGYTVEASFELACAQCHDPHGSSNLYTIMPAVVLSPAGGITTGLVVFTNITGTDSYDEADTASGVPESTAQTADDICATCHNNPNNIGYPMTNHFGGDDHLNGTDYRGRRCISCHPHEGGFIHGAGASGTDCVRCHGHDAGTLYDPDASYPYTAGTEASQGSGSSHSHSTHTESDADDLIGPAIYCDSCHDINNFPFFKSGTDGNGDGLYDLGETDVCNACHSPGGTYDGVDEPVIGAKNNWSSGVYTGTNLISGKEKWCASCHDEEPSVISTTVVISAPNVIGDQDGNYTYDAYSLGWGYYKTGHGLADTETYPASGEITDGAGLDCDDCHDFAAAHIDGLAQTFDDGDSSTTDPSVYRQGYRLKLVGGQEPMQVPWTGGSSLPNNAERFRLCYGCHDPGPFTDASNMNTNLITGCQVDPPTSCVNRHVSHLARPLIHYSADWDATLSSRMTCVVCHNVHGSTRLAMVRDGKLIDREPGLQIWYNNDDMVTNISYTPYPPDPEDVQLDASTGTIWIGASSSNLCTHCHGSGNTHATYRTPFQPVAKAPTLAWTGESSYLSDGVDPDSAPAGSVFEFRIEYTDQNNDAPSPIEVWVDVNDNGSYESSEIYTMTEAVLMDNNLTDGKIYVKHLTLSKAGDNRFNYRFYASDGSLIAPQPLTRAVTVTNNLPTLAWTEETYFESDGVHPDVGARGSEFEFRVTYTDRDGDAPTTIQVWIDENENDVYDSGEKHTMTAVSGLIASGLVYSYSATLTDVVDGVIDYTFRANDGTGEAITDSGPLADNEVIVAPSSNNPPLLDWVVEDCRTQGVKPVRGLATGDFEFKVKYTDLDNQCPPTDGYVSVWIDEDDDDVTDVGETYTMTAAAGNCASGKIYSITVPLDYNGDGNLKYRFIASDGIDPATGDATGAGNEVTVVSTAEAIGVRKGSGDSAPWYNQIQPAIDAGSYQTILVYEGVYTENLLFSGSADGGITLESACGPDLTTISSVSPLSDTVYFWVLDYSIIDGFTISGGSNGMYMQNTGMVTVTGSIIRDNSRGIYVGNGVPGFAVSNTLICDNSGVDGVGIYFKGQGSYNVTNSIIQDNTATGDGGGLYRLGGTITIRGSTVRGNSATGLGGGVYINGGAPTFIESSVISNTAGSLGGGVYANASVTFIKSSVRSNAALGGAGGGAFVNAGGRKIILENSNLTDNTSNSQGGGIYLNGSTALITNSVVSGNSLVNPSGVQGGGGIYANSGIVLARNSIFWNNQAGMNGSGHECYANGTASVSFTYCDVLNDRNTLGGNYSYSVDSSSIEADPFFVGGLPYDYHLRSISPAIDAGTSLGAPGDDIDGDSRPQGGFYDMGSDEVLETSGRATPPLPDEASDTTIYSTYLPLIVRGPVHEPESSKDGSIYLPSLWKEGRHEPQASRDRTIYLPSILKSDRHEPEVSKDNLIYLPAIVKGDGHKP